MNQLDRAIRDAAEFVQISEPCRFFVLRQEFRAKALRSCPAAATSRMRLSIATFKFAVRRLSTRAAAFTSAARSVALFRSTSRTASGTRDRAAASTKAATSIDVSKRTRVYAGPSASNNERPSGSRACGPLAPGTVYAVKLPML